MQSERTGSVPAEPGTKRQGFLQRLIGVYFEPRPTFENIDKTGGWLGIFILICAFGIGSMYVLRSRMDYPTYMRKAMQMNPMTRQLSEEQIEAAINQPERPIQRYAGVVMAPIGILAAYAVSAAVLLVIFLLFGLSINFKRSFRMTMWAMAPPAFVNMVLGIIMMFVKDPESLEIDPSANVASNLGLLASQRDQPVLHSLLASMDVFSFWAIVLLAIGFSVMSGGRMKTGKAAVGVVIAWAIWVLGKAGFTALFS